MATALSTNPASPAQGRRRTVDTGHPETGGSLGSGVRRTPGGGCDGTCTARAPDRPDRCLRGRFRGCGDRRAGRGGLRPDQGRGADGAQGGRRSSRRRPPRTTASTVPRREPRSSCSCSATAAPPAWVPRSGCRPSAAILATGVSAFGGRRVRLTNVAVVGAVSGDLGRPGGQRPRQRARAGRRGDPHRDQRRHPPHRQVDRRAAPRGRGPPAARRRRRGRRRHLSRPGRRSSRSPSRSVRWRDAGAATLRRRRPSRS